MLDSDSEDDTTTTTTTATTTATTAATTATTTATIAATTATTTATQNHDRPASVNDTFDSRIDDSRIGKTIMNFFLQFFFCFKKGLLT